MKPAVHDLLKRAFPPKLTQDAQDRLNAGLDSAKEHLNDENFEKACRTLEELDGQYPGNPVVEVLLRQARERLRGSGADPEVEKLLSEARGKKAFGRFEPALQLVQRALELDPSSESARALQKTLLDEQQRDRDRKTIETELQRCQLLVKKDELQEALLVVEELAVLYPRDARVAEARREINEKVRKHGERYQRPESATQMLGNLAIQFPAKSSVQDLLGHARDLKLSQQPQDRLNAGLDSAKALLKSDDFGLACRALEQLDREYPNTPAVEVLLAHARERLRAEQVAGQIGRLLAEAERQLAGRLYDQALESVDRALELEPANHDALALRRTLLEEQKADRDRRKIDGEVEKLQALLREQKLDLAHAAVDRLVTEYPHDTRVAGEKREIDIRLRKRDQQRRRDFETGVRECERLLSDGKFEAATRLLGVLAAEFPAETSLGALLNRARQLEQEQSREKIRKTLAEAREFVSRLEWEQALGVINEALRIEPDCAEYIEEAGNIQRLRLRDQELSAIEAAVAGGYLEQAIYMAEAALARFPAEPRAIAALHAAHNLRELNDLVLYARRRVRNGDLDEAREIVADGRLRFPDSPELLEIESEIEKAGTLEQSLGSVRRALKERRFDEARKIADPLFTAFPENPAVRELLAEIRTQDAESERQQTYDRGRADAERLARSLSFQAAIDKIQQLLDDFPADPALNEDLNRVCAARDLHTRREGYLRGRAEAQSLSDRGKLEEAITVIRRMLEAFPSDPALDADLKAMQAAKFLREERVGIDALIKELEVFFRNGDAEAVRRGAKQLLAKRKEPRAAELLDWAEKSIAKTREIRNKSRSRDPLLLSGGIGVVAAAVVVGAILGLPPGLPPAPAPPITVQPAEIVFPYARGGPVPKPRSFQIKTGRQDQKWTAASSDPWLRFSRADGTGTSDVEASVDPSALTPGEHESIVTVHSASVQKTMIVRVLITEPPASTPPPPPVIKIEPSQLEFSYTRTGAPPPSQRFRIVTIPASQSWTTTTEGAWVAPSRHSGAGTSEVEVSIDPAGLATGDHTGIVKVTSGTTAKVLQVLLQVTEPKLLFDPQVNCHDDQYNGRYTGTISWLGPLNDGEVLTISNKNVASAGRASGRELPGCPVSVTSVPPLGIQEPSAETNYRQIRFINKSGHPIDSIKITWNVE